MQGFQQDNAEAVMSGSGIDGFGGGDWDTGFSREDEFQPTTEASQGPGHQGTQEEAEPSEQTYSGGYTHQQVSSPLSSSAFTKQMPAKRTLSTVAQLSRRKLPSAVHSFLKCEPKLE